MDNKNRDRGTIKWTAMMLPEHVKLLREWYDEDHFVPEPQLDEFDFEELAHQIQTAVQTHSMILIYYWNNGDSFIVEGTIKKLPVNTPYFTILSPQGDKRIYIPHIMKIRLYDA